MKQTIHHIITAITLLATLALTPLTMANTTEQITSRDEANDVCPNTNNITEFSAYGRNNSDELFNSLPLAFSPEPTMGLFSKTDPSGNPPAYGKIIRNEAGETVSITCFYEYQGIDIQGEPSTMQTQMTYYAQ